MHRVDNSRFLLYIEPKARQKSKRPIDDEVTKTVKTCFNKARSGVADYSDLKSNGSFREGGGWRGFHTVDCGKLSDNKDYLLENGMITNSLCVFYLRYYRKAIPESEMQKIMNLCAWVDIEKIYQLSTKLYYEVADDNMKRRGHPGIKGPPSDRNWSMNVGMIEGAIKTLNEVLTKLKPIKKQKL